MFQDDDVLQFACLGTELAPRIGDASEQLHFDTSWIMDFGESDAYMHGLSTATAVDDWNVNGVLSLQQKQEEDQEQQQQLLLKQHICDLEKKKKMNHNAYERQRRKKVNALYQALDLLMPPPYVHVSHKKKANNQAVLKRALAYIPWLKWRISELKEQKRKLLNQAATLNSSELKEQKRKLLNHAPLKSSDKTASVKTKSITVSSEGRQTVLTLHLSAQNKQCAFALLAFLDNIHSSMQVLSASMFSFASSAWIVFQIQNDGSLDNPVDFPGKIEGFLKTKRV